MADKFEPFGGGLPATPDLYASLTPRKRSNVTVDTGLVSGWFVEKRVAREARISESEAKIENAKASQIEAVNRQVIGAATFGDQLDLARFSIKCQAENLKTEVVTKQAEAKIAVSRSEEAFYNAKSAKLDHHMRVKNAKSGGFIENEEEWM